MMNLNMRGKATAFCFQKYSDTVDINEPPPRFDAAGVLSVLANRLEDQDVMRLTTLGLMSAGIAHDLGNLLQVVNSAVRLIERRVDPRTSAELRPLTEGALEAIDRAACLSRRILDLTKSQGAVHEITFLDKTVSSLEGLIALTAGPSIVVDITAGDDVPAVICNARELENAILNLVINARDAMPDGGCLSVSVYREDGSESRNGRRGDDYPKAVLCITDTGCGIPPELAAEVFEPFVTTKPKDRGTGLGLAMVSDFARRAGGSAEIDSEVGEGTTVTLRLPGCGE